MRKLLVTALALSLLAGAAWAQTITRSLQGSQDPRGPVGLDSNYNAYLPNHLLATQGIGSQITPTVVGGTLYTSATDLAGVIATTATSMGITFGTPFVQIPACILQEQNGTTVPTFTVYTTQLSATTVVSSKNYSYQCIGNQ
jgi:hypothetical protein